MPNEKEKEKPKDDLARKIVEACVTRLWDECNLKLTSLIIRNSPEGPKAYFEALEYLDEADQKPTIKEIYSERPQTNRP